MSEELQELDEAPDDSPEQLQELIAECKRLINDPATDDLTKKRMTKVREAAEQKMATVTKEKGVAFVPIQADWDRLMARCIAFFNDEGAWWNLRIAEEHAGPGEMYEYIRKTVAEMEAAAAKTTTKKRNGGAKAPQGLPDFSALFSTLLQHATNLGLEGQVIWDELGLGEINTKSLDAFRAEIDRRVTLPGDEEDALPEVDEDESDPKTMSSQTSTTTIPATSQESTPISQTDTVPTAANPNTNPETGEVSVAPMLQILGLTEMPAALTDDHMNLLTNIMGDKLSQAAQFRDQAEKKARPLEEGARAWENAFGALMDAYAEKHALRVKTGPNAGKVVSGGKTLHFERYSISWQKSGGAEIADEGLFRTELARIAADEKLSAEWKISIKPQPPKYDYDREAIAKRVEEEKIAFPGFKVTPVKDFAFRKVKV